MQSATRSFTADQMMRRFHGVETYAKTLLLKNVNADIYHLQWRLNNAADTHSAGVIEKSTAKNAN